MKNKKLTLAVSTISFILIFSTILYSQNKSNIPVNGKGHPALGPEKTTNIPVKNISPEVTALLQQQRQAKLSGDNNAVLNLQRQLDALTGDGYTTANLVSAGTGHFLDPGTDNIVNSLIVTSNGNMKAFAFATEQRGPNAGRIWAACGYSPTSLYAPDTIRVYYSDNGGLAWSENSIWIPGGISKINSYDMDMEIMEYNTGNKYVWITIGLKDNQGQEYAAILIIQTPTPAGGFYSLTWPGGTNNTSVYHPRITSDNANYPTSQSWNFIIASRDTITPNGLKFCEKFVKCTNPFTTAPTLTYKASAYCIDKSFGSGSHIWRSTYDIGCFRNGGNDSIIVVESDLPDTSIIYACKSGLSPEVSGAYNFASMDGGVTTSNWKRAVRVVCNGNKNIMIAYRSNYQNIGDWDIRYAYSTNGGLNASSWNNGYIDGTRSTMLFPRNPDLVGLRGSDSYKCSYMEFINGANRDSAMLASAPNGVWNTPQKVSFSDASGVVEVHAGYRFVNNDSCIVLWSQYPNFLWSATGCSGLQMIGINNNGNTLPKTYSLEQNYPNPFNPKTIINYQLPISNYVKLYVYDLMGREVCVLVNQKQNAGTYEVEWPAPSGNASDYANGVYFYTIQAGDFRDTKKMILVR